MQRQITPLQRCVVPLAADSRDIFCRAAVRIAFGYLHRRSAEEGGGRLGGRNKRWYTHRAFAPPIGCCLCAQDCTSWEGVRYLTSQGDDWHGIAIA